MATARRAPRALGTAEAAPKRTGKAPTARKVPDAVRKPRKPNPKAQRTRKPQPRSGRPRGTDGLTPELQGSIIERVERGHYIEDACLAAGVSRDTFYRWVRRGDDERARVAGGGKPDPIETRFVHFSDATAQARAVAVDRDLLAIDLAAKQGEWRAAAWRLERRDPRKWGRLDRTEVTGADGGPVAVAHEVPPQVIAEALGHLRDLGVPPPGEVAGEDEGEEG